MEKKNIPRILIANILAFLIIFVGSVPLAAKETIIAEYTYNMGLGETLEGAEDKAILNAKRIALEQAGTYVESSIEVLNGQVKTDKILALTSGIIEISILEKKNYSENNSIYVYVKIQTIVDNSKIEGVSKNLELLEQNNKLQKDNQILLRQIEDLKKCLQNAQDNQTKERVLADMKENEQNVRANEWLEKANQLYFSKRYDEALVAYSKALKSNFQLDFAYNNRGNIYNNIGRYDLAINEFTQAIALTPNYVHAYNNRGVSYYHKKKYSEALRDLTKAIQLDSSYANAYQNRAQVYKTLGNYDLALRDLENIIQLTGGDVQVYNARGFLYNQHGSYDLAIADFDKALSLDPNNADAYNNRGFSWQQKGKHKQAVDDFDRAIANNLENPYTYYNKAISMEFLKRSREAIAAYRQFLQYAETGDSLIPKVKERIKTLNLIKSE